MIHVLGANGQLGQCLQKHSFKQGVVFYSSSEINICNDDHIYKLKERVSEYDIIINCAAYTNVDQAQSNPNIAYSINSDALNKLSKLSKDQNTYLIHISTDYVFNGETLNEYIETDPTAPINIYGKSKLKGEKNIISSNCNYIIIRTSWLYSQFGKNFLTTMISLSNKSHINVIYDQIGSPTYAMDLADIILKITYTPALYNRNIYHFSNKGSCSWYEFSKHIFNRLSSCIKVTPIKTSEYTSNTPRPSHSVLNCDKIANALNIKIPHWEESLDKCIRKIS